MNMASTLSTGEGGALVAPPERLLEAIWGAFYG